MRYFCPTCNALRYWDNLLPQCKAKAVEFDGTFPMWEASMNDPRVTCPRCIAVAGRDFSHVGNPAAPAMGHAMLRHTKTGRSAECILPNEGDAVS